jgi:hypothetical protein
MSIETRIKESLDKMAEGWRQGDGKLFAKPFSNEAHFVAFGRVPSQTKHRLRHGGALIISGKAERREAHRSFPNRRRRHVLTASRGRAGASI